jgi:hypothetical protein
MQRIISLLTPSGVAALLMGIAVAILAAAFTLYHVGRAWRERRQEQGGQWYRRSMILLGSGLLLFTVASTLQVIVVALTIHGFLPYVAEVCVVFLTMASIFLYFAIIVSILLRRIQRRL